jgi:hypothetical protein
MASARFYLGKWEVVWPPDPSVEQRDTWALPQTEEDLKETSNVQELDLNPEDMFLPAEDIQSGQCEWVVGDGDGASDTFQEIALDNALFYPGFYFGYVAAGRFPQTIPIAPDFFYPIGIESGSAGSAILEF